MDDEKNCFKMFKDSYVNVSENFLGAFLEIIFVEYEDSDKV